MIKVSNNLVKLANTLTQAQHDFAAQVMGARTLSQNKFMNPANIKQRMADRSEGHITPVPSNFAAQAMGARTPEQAEFIRPANIKQRMADRTHPNLPIFSDFNGSINSAPLVPRVPGRHEMKVLQELDQKIQAIKKEHEDINWAEDNAIQQAYELEYPTRFRTLKTPTLEQFKPNFIKRRQELRDKEVLDGLYKNSSVRDYLASYAPVITGLGGGFAGLHASDGSVPVALVSSILGSLGGIPIMYLLSSEQQKKKYRKNPATAVGSFGLVF
jgi:hypothetical protein